MPNRCSLTYDYDGAQRLNVVTSRGSLGNPLNWVWWNYPIDFKRTPKLEIISWDDRKVCYIYQKQRSYDDKGKHRYCLKSVIREHAPEVSYEYRYVNKKTMERMIRKSLPDNRYLTINYFEEGFNQVGSKLLYISTRKDARVGRVSALYAPVGSDSSPVLTWSFTYHLNKHHQSSKPIGGSAEVTDALGHKKIYLFSDQQRLTAVKHLLNDGRAYRTEKMLWHTKGDNNTFLQARGFAKGSGGCLDALLLIRRDYLYDDSGNVLKETLAGNLTGCGNENLPWRSFLQAEQYIKTYSYIPSGLLETESDNRKRISYAYEKDTNLVSLKLISDSQGIRERYHCTYDNNSTKVMEIMDNGVFRDINNLSGVSERKIKRISPTETRPFGLPESIEESFLNLTTGQEELLSRVQNTYSKEGYLLTQMFYDNGNNYCYSKEWSYDQRGNITQEKNPLGQITTYKYDQNNNRIYQQTANSEYHTRFFYDYSNRLIREEKVYNTGDSEPFSVQSLSYDFMGNIIAKTDKYNNTTNYVYDEFGRVIEIIYPAVLNINGELERHVEKIGYDCLNNQNVKINANGYKTEFKYTAWGKPYEIVSADGSVVKNIYHEDGILKKTIDSNGVETHYAHDYKGRKIREEKISPEGECLSVHQWIYDSYHLVEEIDPAGYKTVYSYDGAGRTQSVRKGDAETRYVYDNLGRQAETWEMYDSGKYRRTVSEFDFLDRLVLETTSDETNTIFSKKSYRYDVNGNRTHVIIHDDHGDSCTETLFNCENQPIKMIQPDGSVTLYEYDNNFQNAFGQTVPLVKETDPKGNQTIKVLDAQGRLAKEEKIDAQGNVLQRSAYLYDGEGNLIRRTDDVLVEGVYQKSITTEFLYDFKNREIACIEAVGEAVEKITRKEYYPGGELSKIIKPDGVVLFHEYDPFWRLVDLYSSDKTVHYVHKYDQNSNLIEVEDLIHNLRNVRTIDENNRMIFEKLGTGLELSYQYDPRGRVKRLVLPDLSEVEYLYNAVNLLTINRKNSKGIFSCNYYYNLSGRIAKMDLPASLGSIDYLYDSCLRTRSIKSKNFSQTIPEDGYDLCGNLIEISQKDIIGELTSCYTYDSLYHLVHETGVGEHSYKFDSLHNRINKDGTDHFLNELNQLTQQGEAQYEYDSNGNQINKNDPEKRSDYQYDALDRLTAVVSGNKKTEYLYDSFHRRLKKSTFLLEADRWVETDSCTFLYQGDKEIGVADQCGQIREMRTLGLGNNEEIGAAVLLEVEDSILVPLHDFRGNVVTLVNVSDGQPIECYRYTAYGEEHIFDNLGQRQSSAFCPWRFCSKRIDPETGWAFFGRRYYDAEVGRWTTPDPLRFVDSPNVYCFVKNRPMRYLDPDGRFISITIGDNYEVCANCFVANCMKEYGGVDWDALEAPNYFYYSTKFRVGNPKDDGLAMTWINGMCNSAGDSTCSAERCSNFAGGREVLGVHNASYGPVLDLFECALGSVGIETPPAKLLKENWDECFNNGAKHILHIGHSQGMIHTRNTTPSYDKNLRKNIEVIGVAPGAHVNRNDFGDAVHYQSRDFVPLLEDFFFTTPLNCMDKMGKRASVVWLDPHPKASWLDHSFDSPTYDTALFDSIGDFFNKYGAK